MSEAPDRQAEAVDVPEPAAEREAVRSAATAAKDAAALLRTFTTDQKNRALALMADAIDAATDRIVEQNAIDVAAAEQAGTASGLVDRLTLNGPRLAEIVAALRDLIELPDPVGTVVRGYTLPNGLDVEQVRVPMGVVGMIYEARPNVTVDAAGLALKSGNACLLRGSSSAARTNTVLVDVMREALVLAGLPRDAIVKVPGESHESVEHLMRARGLVDVLIPRGGAALIDRVVQGSVVPVIETGIGNCHVYVDAAADVPMAVNVAVNAKVQRPSVCNAAETLLVHADVAKDFLPAVAKEMAAAGVTLHCDERVAALVADSQIKCLPVTDQDWAVEYYSLDLAVGVVDDIDGAISHIRRWSTGHTEAILSDSATAIRTFLAGVDSAAVAVNASTRFTDGGQLGFGAEIGISTQKLHARGPMALPELTTTTFVITGEGQVRG